MPGRCDTKNLDRPCARDSPQSRRETGSEVLRLGADESTPLETLALVTGTRWRVEEFFEDGKDDFGMSDYEALRGPAGIIT